MSSVSHAVEQRPGIPSVLLAWDGTGDFGPETPGTKTAGWQEALDYCVAHAQDLYVKGGWGGRKAIYHVQDTIRVPATQDFRIDGGVYVINWIGPPDDPAKDLMVIDSTMNGEYHFGIFVYGGAGAGLRIRPENPVPIDGFAVFVETEIKSQGIADPNPFKPGERKAGTGLFLDGTKAAIVNNRFDFIGGILNFKTCVESRGGFAQNHFNCLHLHTNADGSTLFKVGSGSVQNIFDLAIGVDMGAGEVRGIDIQGRNNTFRIMTRGGFPKSNDVILAEPAAGNRIDLIHDKDTFDPADFVTDHAATPTNRLTWTGGSIPLCTVPVPAGEFTYVQRLYPAAVRLEGDSVTSVKRVRGDSAIAYRLPCQGDLLLGVGDALEIESTGAASLHIAPLPLP